MGVVDEVKDRLDIVEVVSSYLRLEKSGRNYKALCPFHSEKTPSFVVFPESQRWYCFGACNEGGDVFNFVMKAEGWDFRATLEELAGRAGVDLEPPTPQQKKAAEEADRLRELLGTAARYYHHLLKSAPEAEAGRAYAEKRALSQGTLDTFQIGYSLPGWDRTRDYLSGQGFELDELLKAGLLVERDGGGAYDRFRERLMIPIRDVRGRVIGFGARTLDPGGVPKYLNSPKTPLFDKSRTLFGLDMARRAIRHEDRVVITEGYMDVMQAHQAGFGNVVAQMGTALTEAQLRQLQRYTKRMVLALDPDAAGVQATLRGMEVAQETLAKEWQPVFNPRGLVGFEGRLGAEMRVLQLPADQDPDDLIREDADRWNRLVDESVPVVDFYFQLLTRDMDLDDTKAKANVVDKLVPVLEAVANPVEREDYVQKIARSLRVDERAVLARVQARGHRGMERYRGLHPAKRQPRMAEQAADERSSADLEAHCISMLLRRPGIFTHINHVLTDRELDSLRAEDFEQPSLRAVFEAWEELLGKRLSVTLEALRESVPSDVKERLDRLIEPDDVKLADEQLIRDIVVTLLRLRQRRLKAFVQDLRLLMMEAYEDGDARGKQYDQAHLAHTQQLLQTQRVLAHSRELG